MSKATDDLVRLLHVASDGYSSVKHDGAAKMCHDAADLIERQAREIESLRAECGLRQIRGYNEGEAERDALRECVRAADEMRPSLHSDGRAKYDTARAKIPNAGT